MTETQPVPERSWYTKKRYALTVLGAAFLGSVALAGVSPGSVEMTQPETSVDSTNVPMTQAESKPEKASATAQSAAVGAAHTEPAAEPAPAPASAQTAPARAAAPQPAPAPARTATTPTRSCHPSYSGCLDPNASDYDCAGGSGNGPRYTGPVRVIGYDAFDLDRDGDGYACE